MIRVAAIFAALLALASCGEAGDENWNDPHQVRAVPAMPAGIMVFADPDTGCEYLYQPGHGIAPRYQYSDGNSDTKVKGCR